jgi:hypothetical protein
MLRVLQEVENPVAYSMAAAHEDLERQQPVPPQNRFQTKDPRLDRLREHERMWMQWVSLLHEHHSKLGTEHSRIVLDIASRRWAAAKQALDSVLDEN